MSNQELFNKVVLWLVEELTNPYNDWSYIDNVDEVRSLIKQLIPNYDTLNTTIRGENKDE